MIIHAFQHYGRIFTFFATVCLVAAAAEALPIITNLGFSRTLPAGLSKFPVNPAPLLSDITTVLSPTGGDNIRFNRTTDHRQLGIGNGRATWSGTPNSIYFTKIAVTSLTIGMAVDTSAFAVWIEPNLFGTHVFTVRAANALGQNAILSDITVEGNGGAHGVLFESQDNSANEVLTTVAIRSGR